MFLFFTNKNKNKITTAVYTGRFAFLNDYTEYDSLEETFKNIKNKSILNDKKRDEIQEEFLHFKIFHKNLSSLFINGFRYVTRLVWRLTGNKYIVKKYYEYRTLFYFVMYQAQESLVDEIKEKEKEVNCCILLKEDSKLFKLILKEEKNILFLLSLIILLPVLIFIGYVITKFFTIIIYKKNELNNYQHQYISDSNIVKDLNRKNTVYNKIGTWIQFENIISKVNNFDKNKQNKEWLTIKFQTEKEMYKNLNITNNPNIWIDTDFNRYLNEIIFFAFGWANVNNGKPTLLSIYHFVNAVQKDINKKNSILNIENLIKDNKEFDRVVEFFYMHGN